MLCVCRKADIVLLQTRLQHSGNGKANKERMRGKYYSCANIRFEFGYRAFEKWVARVVRVCMLAVNFVVSGSRLQTKRDGFVIVDFNPVGVTEQELSGGSTTDLIRYQHHACGHSVIKQ